jgi:hypothetical protein
VGTPATREGVAQSFRVIRFQADADLNRSIVHGVRRREPAIDFATAADSGLEGASDESVLAFAASSGRILISHDHRTMIEQFRNMRQLTPIPSLFLVRQSTPVGAVIDAIVLVWSASCESEWTNQLRYLPSLTRHDFKLR